MTGGRKQDGRGEQPVHNEDKNRNALHAIVDQLDERDVKIALQFILHLKEG